MVCTVRYGTCCARSGTPAHHQMVGKSCSGTAQNTNKSVATCWVLRAVCWSGDGPAKNRCHPPTRNPFFFFLSFQVWRHLTLCASSRSTAPSGPSPTSPPSSPADSPADSTQQTPTRRQSEMRFKGQCCHHVLCRALFTVAQIFACKQ